LILKRKKKKKAERAYTVGDVQATKSRVRVAYGQCANFGRPGRHAVCDVGQNKQMLRERCRIRHILAHRSDDRAVMLIEKLVWWRTS
jgi:hypothetical protein